MLSDMNIKVVSVLRGNGKRTGKTSNMKLVDSLILDHEFKLDIKLVNSFSHYSKITGRTTTEKCVFTSR